MKTQMKNQIKYSINSQESHEKYIFKKLFYRCYKDVRDIQWWLWNSYKLLNQLSGKMKILLFKNMFYMILYSYFNIFLSSLQKNQYRLPSLPVRHSSETHFSISLMYFALDLMWSKCSKAVQVSSMDSGLISAESQLDVLIKSEKFSWSHSIKSWTMGSGGSDRAVSSKCSLRSWHCFLDKWLEVMLTSGGVWG